MDFMLFGKSYPEVHAWLDDNYANQPGYFHWLDHHHLEAIKTEYGEYTMEYYSAYMHILSDWLSHWDRLFVPTDRKDVIAKLTEIGYIQIGDFVE